MPEAYEAPLRARALIPSVWQPTSTYGETVGRWEGFVVVVVGDDDSRVLLADAQDEPSEAVGRTTAEVFARYSSSRLPAPQYWNGFPAHVIPHSSSGAGSLDG